MKNRTKYQRKYYQKNKEHILEQRKEHYQDHKEHTLEQHKEHYQNNKKEIAEQHKKYYQDNKEEIKEQHKKYNKTEKGKETIKRSNHKRRDLGFDQLNKPFEGCESHHINKNHVIFIDRNIHRSIYHTLKKPETMTKINFLALEFLTKDWNGIKIEGLIK